MSERYNYQIKKQLHERPIPEKQQSHTAKNEGAYVFLYLCIVFGIFLFVLLGWGIYRDHQKKSKQRAKDKEEAKKKLKNSTNIYPDPNVETPFAKSAAGGTPTMVTKLEEVQPPKRKSSSPPGRYTTNLTIPMHADRDQLFGNHNKHQRRKQYSLVPTVGTTTPATSSTTLDGTSTITSSEGPSSSCNEDNVNSRLRREVSRQESFPFEQFAMPLEDREPRTTRMENIPPMTDYLRFTAQPSFMQEEQEERDTSPFSIRMPSGSEEEEEEFRPRSEINELDDAFGNSSTLPMRHDHGKKKNVVSDVPWPDE